MVSGREWSVQKSIHCSAAPKVTTWECVELSDILICHWKFPDPDFCVNSTSFKDRFFFSFLIFICNSIIWVLFLEKAMAPHSSTLAWKVPWTEEPGGLQSMSTVALQSHVSAYCTAR